MCKKRKKEGSSYYSFFFQWVLLSTCSTRLKIKRSSLSSRSLQSSGYKVCCNQGHVNGVTMGQKWTDTVGAQIEALGKQVVGT